MLSSVFFHRYPLEFAQTVYICLWTVGEGQMHGWGVCSDVDAVY